MPSNRSDSSPSESEPELRQPHGPSTNDSHAQNRLGDDSAQDQEATDDAEYERVPRPCAICHRAWPEGVSIAKEEKANDG